MVSFEEFKTVITKSRNFWRSITKSTLIAPSPMPAKDNLIDELYQQIVAQTYIPSPPRGSLIINKGMGVVRRVPVFEVRDLCVYFYAVMSLEDIISGNRVPYTYGGWTGSNAIREMEGRDGEGGGIGLRHFDTPDGEGIDLVVDDDNSEYPMIGSFDPRAWSAQWKEFTSKAYEFSRVGGYTSFIELDIANFYDSIRLDVLQEKLRRDADDETNTKIDILMRFLGQWKKGSDVSFQSKGIPQDETGDCSRLLANFYLQDFDSDMEEICARYGARYLRFADDQIIMLRDPQYAEEVVCLASIALDKYDLSINQKKVKIFDRSQFEEYFCFNPFLELSGSPDVETIERYITFYAENKNKLRKHGRSLMKRLISFLSPSLSAGSIRILRDDFFSSDYLSSSDFDNRSLSRWYDFFRTLDKESVLMELLNTKNQELIHNRFHYILRKFYIDKGFDVQEIDLRLIELESFYSTL